MSFIFLNSGTVSTAFSLHSARLIVPWLMLCASDLRVASSHLALSMKYNKII